MQCVQKPASCQVCLSVVGVCPDFVPIVVLQLVEAKLKRAYREVQAKPVTAYLWCCCWSKQDSSSDSNSVVLQLMQAELQALTETVVLQLVEAKLKRAYQEGQAARAAGQDPLAAELAASTHRLRAQAATLAAPIIHILQEDSAPVQDPAPSQAAAELAGDQEQQPATAVTSTPAAGTTEQELSVAQADANMAALLQEEAG